MTRKQQSTKSSSTLTTEQRLRLRNFDQSWDTQKLSTGLQVVHIPRPHDQRIYLGATVGVGSRLENPQQLGISHFLEHMMFRGSQRYPTFRKLAEAFEWMGGEWNAGTGQEHTEYWYSGSAETLPHAAELFFEFLANPKLNDIDIERKIIYREIDGELNEYGLSTDLDFHTHRLLWPGSPLANPVMGTKETLANISQTDLRHYRQKHYRADNMCIVVVGGTSPEQITRYVEAAFVTTDERRQQKSEIPRLKNPRGPHVELIKHPDNEYFVQLSFRTKGEWHREATNYDLIRRLLADGFCSRLGHRIREQLGMVYDIDAEVTLFSDTGSFDIYAHISLDKMLPFIKETVKILNSLKQDGPKSRELERAKRRSLNDLELLPYDPDHLGFKIGWSVLNSKKPSFERGFETIASKSVADIQQVCEQLFCAKHCSFVMLGPERNGLVQEIRELLSQALG